MREVAIVHTVVWWIVWRIHFRSRKLWNEFDTIVEITCKPGSAAVARTSYCSYGKEQLLQLSRAETTIPINTKFWTIDYVGEMKRIVKVGWDWFHGGISLCGWNIHFSWFSSSFFDQATDHNSQQILMHYGSKSSFGVRMCLLGVGSVKIDCKGAKSPKSGPVRKSQPKRKRSKVPYNFVIKRNTAMVLMKQ